MGERIPQTYRIVERDFAVAGDLTLGVSDVVAKGGDYQPARRLGGWAAPVGFLGQGGEAKVTPDRDNQDIEVAVKLGRIDWSGYITKGIWNDGHLAPLPNGNWPPHARDRIAKGNTTPVYVGVPTGLVYAAPESELAKAHGKWGFYTWGHLFDRDDPRSWMDFTDHVPTSEDLDRADYYYDIAKSLESTDARLGFSIHGTASFSPCRRRITGATLPQLAVVTSPKVPGATLDLIKGQTIEMQMGRADVSPAVCGRCQCPPGSCVLLVKGGMDAAAIAPALPQDLEGWTRQQATDVLVAEICRSISCEPQEAMQIVGADADAQTLLKSLPEASHA